MVPGRRVALALVLVAGCGGGDETLGPAELAAEIVDESIDSNDEWLRAETVRLMSATHDGQFATTVRRAIDDPSPIVQTAALEALLHTGVRSIEEKALGIMVSGGVGQRLQLLRLAVEDADDDFRGEIILRGTRDIDARVRAAAIHHAMDSNTPLSFADLERLIADEDAATAEAAFLALVRFERAASLDLVLDGLQSDEPEERTRAMQLARHLSSPSVWPTMRSYAAQDDDIGAQRLALIVLGFLGDPIAEDPLRNLLLQSTRDSAELAATALEALSHIPTERAVETPIVHRRHPQPAVRAAALDAMIRQQRPADDFDIFLQDSEPKIAERALLHMQRSDPERAAGVFSNVLGEASDPKPALEALVRVSLRADISRFLRASSARLIGYAVSDDAELAALASHLLMSGGGDPAIVELLLESPHADALYALLEHDLGKDPTMSDLYTESLDHDLLAIRTVAALGILTLGDAYVPPATDEEAAE